MLFSFLKAKTNLKKTGFDHRGNIFAGYEEVLGFFDREGLYPDFREIQSGVNQPECKIGGKTYLSFCSNNYLALTEDVQVKEAAIKSIEKYGVGPGGSRAVSGTIDVIVELEEKIAKLTGCEDCLTFPTGYMVNVGIVKALMDSFFMGMPYPTEGGVIFSDEYNHGSIVDGCKLSRATKKVFKHNQIDELERLLAKNRMPHKLIITEGVFSTEGEILDLEKYVALAEKYSSMLMIDDAHGVGVLGGKGGGTPEETGTQGRIHLLMGSMDKAFGGTGGYICSTKGMIRYLRVAMSSSILSSAIPTGAAAAMSKAVDLIASEEGAKRRAILHDNSSYLREQLRDRGFKVLGDSNLAAVPLMIGGEKKALQFSKMLFDEGIFTSVFRWPAVPAGKARLRLTLMSSHTQGQIDSLVLECEKAGRAMKLI